MKYPKILSAFALLSILGMEGHSETLLYIYQTNTFAVNSGSISKQWQQFDPTLGTLTGITFEASAALSGSFDVENQNLSNLRIRVRYSNDKINVAFQDSVVQNGVRVYGPGDFFGTEYDPILTIPDSGTDGTYINRGVTTTFNINNGQTMILPLEDLFLYDLYFTGLGTVSTDFSQLFNVTVTGGAYTVNSDNVLANGSATLTYIYQVPEPSAASLLIFGLGGLVAVRCVRRKS
jgi:hypothetical protein